MNYVAPVSTKYSGTWGRYASGGVHRAIDYPVGVGTAVRNAGAGKVTVAGWSTSGFGNHVRVLLDDGNTVIYGHLSRSIVRVGQRVSAGQVIAYSGNTGNSTGPHLHMEVRKSSWVPETSWNFVSKLVAYRAPSTTTTKPAAPTFNLNKLKYKASNTEVKRFQQWLFSKHNVGYRDNFNKTVYNFSRYGYTTFYGNSTARMVQDMYRYLHKAYPKGGWNQGWVNGVPPKEPGPGLIKHFGGKPYRA